MALHSFVLLGVVAVVVLAVLEGAARRSDRRAWPVYARPILSEAERSFYARLCAAIPDRRVLCQVQIGQFVEVKDVRSRVEVRNRYDRLTADFVVCSEDFRVVVVVELDDSSHDRPVQRARDAKKDAVLAAAGVPVVRFRSPESVERIREDVLKAVGGLNQAAGRLGNVGGAGRKLPYIGAF